MKMKTLSENEMTTISGGQAWAGRKPSKAQVLSSNELATINGGMLIPPHKLF